MLNAGNSSDVGKNVAVVGRDDRRIFGAVFWHRQKEGEDVVGFDAEIDVGKVPEAVDVRTAPASSASASANSPMTRMRRRKCLRFDSRST
jgi:hypothetical protein